MADPHRLGGDRQLAALADAHLGALAVGFLEYEPARELGEVLAEARLDYRPQPAPAGQGCAVTARLRLPPPVYRRLTGTKVEACINHVDALLRCAGYALQTFLAVPDETTEPIRALGLPREASDVAARIHPEAWTSAIDVDAVIQRYRDGATVNELAAEYDVTVERLRHMLPRELKQARRPRGRVDVDTAARLHAQGWTLTAIAEHFGVTRQRIRQLLPDDAKQQAQEPRSRVDVDAAARWYLDGWSQADIAEHFGVTASRISVLLPEHVKQQARQRGRSRRSRVDVDAAARWYLEGWSQADIAEHFGVTAARIAQLLPADVKQRDPRYNPGARAQSRVDVDAAARWYLEGWTLAAIAEHFGVTRERIRQLLPADVKQQAKRARTSRR